MVLQEYANGDLIEAVDFNARTIRRGSTADIEALTSTEVAVGDGFYDTDRHAWVIVSKIDGINIYYSVFTNQLYQSDVLIGYETGSYEVARTLEYSTNDTLGHGNFVMVVLNYISYAGAGNIKVTISGNSTSVEEIFAVSDDPGVNKELVMIIDATSTKDNQGATLKIELQDVKVNIMEVNTI